MSPLIASRPAAGVDPRVRSAAVAWLAALRELKRSGRDPVTDEKLDLYAEMLSRDFDGDDFSMAALHAVLAGDDDPYFPACNTIRRRLRNHLTNAPSSRTPDRRSASLTSEEAYWVFSLRETINCRPAWARRWLLFVEQNHPRTFAQIELEFGADRLGQIVGILEVMHDRPELGRELALLVARAELPRRLGPQAPFRTPEEQIAALSGERVEPER